MEKSHLCILHAFNCTFDPSVLLLRLELLFSQTGSGSICPSTCRSGTTKNVTRLVKGRKGKDFFFTKSRYPFFA